VPSNAPRHMLSGPHHFTGVTRDAAANVDFWCRVMGLRFVKNTLNYETTFRYHLYFGDEDGSPGSIVTFGEANELEPGRPGRGDIQRIVLRLGSPDSLEFWYDRMIQEQNFCEMLRIDPDQPKSIVFSDPEGHDVELMVSDATDPPLAADADDIPAAHRILGIEGARSYASPDEMLPAVEQLGFTRDGDRLLLQGAERSARWYFSPAPNRPSGGWAVGVWHHIAFGAGDHAGLQAWRDYATTGAVAYTPIYDHYFFESSYGMSPAGRIELCTTGPGFEIDESHEELGNRLSLAPRVEPMRAKLERELTPIANPRPRSSRKHSKNSPPSAV
jgi:glyoxalase family protein